MFANGAYVKLWKVEKGKGRYYVAQMSSSKKNQDGEYETDFSSNFVRLVGTAAQQAERFKGGERLQIDSCGVTNHYDKNTKKEYTNFVVFAFVEDGGQSQNKKPSKKAVEEVTHVPDTDEEELPFN